jgi:hypothetical protein
MFKRITNLKVARVGHYTKYRILCRRTYRLHTLAANSVSTLGDSIIQFLDQCLTNPVLDPVNQRMTFQIWGKIG